MLKERHNYCLKAPKEEQELFRLKDTSSTRVRARITNLQITNLAYKQNKASLLDTTTFYDVLLKEEMMWKQPGPL